MQLIVTRVEDKEWNSKIEFSYNEHEYMLNYINSNMLLEE